VTLEKQGTLFCPQRHQSFEGGEIYLLSLHGIAPRRGQMMMSLRRPWAVLIPLTFLWSVGSAVWAQQPQELVGRLVENYRKLRQYSWSMRTDVRLITQQQCVTLEKMRYDLDGRLQATPMGGEREPHQ
jgi:hypothetical protein